MAHRRTENTGFGCQRQRQCLRAVNNTRETEEMTPNCDDPKVYIDSDGVKRGYYVYVHREPNGGKVFYVGKGQGRRAWVKTGRHELWHEKVASLNGVWEVEIAEGDLSEIEACEREAELVLEYGGPASCGGTLTNWVPGGEDPMSMLGVTIPCPAWLTKWIEAYEAAREFKKLSRQEQEGVILQLRHDLSPIMMKLDDLFEIAEDQGDEELESSFVDVDCIIGSQLALGEEFLRRRVTFKDFALGLEEMLEDLSSREIDEWHPKVQRHAKKAARMAKKLFNVIDSGNEKSAKDTADRLKTDDS